jgi:hypothetical protein
METTINGNIYIINSIGNGFVSYGHQRLTCNFTDAAGNNRTHSIITTDTQLTDSMRDDDSEVEDAARMDAANRVINDFLG